MERIYRQLSSDIKKRISDSMKKYHSQMTDDVKQKLNNKKSESLKNYWRSIPDKREEEDEQEEQSTY